MYYPVAIRVSIRIGKYCNLSLGQSGKHNNKMSVDCIVDRHYFIDSTHRVCVY